MERQDKKDGACKACRACANYGFGCQRPMTQEEVDTDTQFYADGPTDRPDCWEKE